MTNKNEVTHWIKAKGHEKFSDTKPEQLFQMFADWLGWKVTAGEPVWSEGMRLRPDFDMILGSPPSRLEIVILIDGNYHFTTIQEKKDRWRDELYVKAGKRVIHIDAGVVDRKYWGFLRYQFHAAVLSKEPAVYIHQ